jgi:proline iminopeptidase
VTLRKTQSKTSQGTDRRGHEKAARPSAILVPSFTPMRPTALMKLITVSAFFLCSLTLTAQPVAHAKGVAHTGQVDIAYETFGTPATPGKATTALPVIAVNGGPGLSHAYMVQNDVWERVARNRMVVLYDQRGTGASKHLQAGVSQSGVTQSGAPQAALSQAAISQTMDAQVADLDAVRQTLGLEKVALVGDSYGGLLVMAYAAAHPEHVAKLVLSDSPGPSWRSIVHVLPEVFPDIEEENAQEEQKLGPATDAAAQAGLRNHFRMIFYSPEKRDAYMSRMGDLGYEPAVAAAVAKATSDLDLTQKLADFKFPALVITGRYDMNVAPLTAWRLAHAIPGAKIVFFEKSGHLPAYEEPEKYMTVLEDFLNGR